MKDSKNDGQLKALRRIIYAGVTFVEVIETCEYLIAHSPKQQSTEEAVQDMAITGLVIAYCRPFDNTAYGLGSLGKDFVRLPENSPLAKMHKDLLDGRDKAFAHYSPLQSALLLSSPEEVDNHPNITVKVRGADVFFHPKRLALSRDALPRIIELCKLHIERLDRETKKLLINMMAGKPYQEGDYLLGKDFP